MASINTFACMCVCVSACGWPCGRACVCVHTCQFWGDWASGFVDMLVCVRLWGVRMRWCFVRRLLVGCVLNGMGWTRWLGAGGAFGLPGMNNRQQVQIDNGCVCASTR